MRSNFGQILIVVYSEERQSTKHACVWEREGRGEEIELCLFVKGCQSVVLLQWRITARIGVEEGGRPVSTLFCQSRGGNVSNRKKKGKSIANSPSCLEKGKRARVIRATLEIDSWIIQLSCYASAWTWETMGNLWINSFSLHVPWFLYLVIVHVLLRLVVLYRSDYRSYFW